MHKHRCGECSHIWEHERPDTSGMDRETGDKFYAEQHLCPQCKAGPWFDKHDSSVSPEMDFLRLVVSVLLLEKILGSTESN